MQVKVKVCGVTLPEDARRAVELGAWAVGLIFYGPSPRACDPAAAEEIAAELRRKVALTGVFVNHPLEPNGGDVPTPIPASTTADLAGGTLAVTMSAPGTFGYQCNFHPGTMFGAIQVVP